MVSLGVTARSIGAAALAAFACAGPAEAYLFWAQPALKGQPVTGDEPGLLVPLPGAKPNEVKANLLWSMRAGLNVAALQCQFAPALMTVNNYNWLMRQHGTELQTAYTAISAYFKRTGGKTWQTRLDQYTTRTYNGFSTMHAQLGFCETAASIGRDAQSVPSGKLVTLATLRMREFRNSLIPAIDQGMVMAPSTLPAEPLPSLGCVDDKGRSVRCRS